MEDENEHESCHKDEGGEKDDCEEEVEKPVLESSNEDDEEEDVFAELFGSRLRKSNSSSTASLTMGLAESLIMNAELEEEEDEEGKEDVGNPVIEEPQEAREVCGNKKENSVVEESVEESEEEVFEDAEIFEHEDPIVPITPTIEHQVKGDWQEQEVETTLIKKITDNEGGNVVFPKYVPKTHEDTWDFSMQALIPDYKGKSMWIEGPFYQKLVENCLHEMHNVYCDCEEKVKAPICRLCHKFFCSNKCYKRVVKAATGALDEEEKKEEMEPQAEISQAVEPEVPKENTEPHCPQPQQQRKEKVKKSVSSELDESTNRKVNETSQTNETVGRSHGQKENRNPKKQPFKTHHFEQTHHHQGGRGFPPPNLWPSQVQMMNAAMTMRGLETVNSSLPFPHPPHGGPQGVLPFNPNMNPLNLPLQRPPIIGHQFNSQGHFPQSMMNAAQFPRSYQQYGDPQQTPDQLPKTKNKMKNSNEHHAISTYSDSQRERTDVSKTPREQGAPVKILRNPRGLETTNTNSNTFNQNQPKKDHEEFSLGSKTHHRAPQFHSTTVSNQGLAEFHQPSLTQGSAPQGKPQQVGVDLSSSSSSRPNTGAPQNPRLRGISEGYDGDDFSSRKRNTAGGGHSPIKDNYVKNKLFKPPYTPNGNVMEQHSDFRKVNNNPGRGKRFPQTSSSSDVNTSEGRGRQDRNKYASTYRGSQDRGPQQNGTVPVSLDPSMGNSLNYSASSREKDKLGQSSVSSSLPSWNPSIQSFGSSTSSLNSERKERDGGGRMPNSKKSDGDPALIRITLDPELPYGIRFPVKCIRGKTFTDFSVMSLKNFELYKPFHLRIQECQKVKMSIFKPKDLCLVQYLTEEKESSATEWYRGIITKVSGNVDVYLVDLGAVNSVPPADLFQLPDEFKMYKPYAIRFRCLNLKLDNADTNDVLKYFDSLVSKTTVKIRVTHKDLKEPHKFAGHLELLHISKWFDASVLLQKFGVEKVETGTEQDIAAEEMNNSIKPLLSVKTAVPELPIMTYSAAATTEISAVLAKVLSLNEFYVTTPELIAKRANIEKQLCSPGVSRDSVSCLQGLSYPLFMVIDDRSQQWVRVKVLEVSTDLKPVSAVVFKIDYGDTMKVPLANLIQLPMKFHEQGCVYKCSLPVKPVPRGRNKNTQAASEEPMHYLSALCNNGVLVDLRLFMVDNLNVHIVELFLENTTSGCTFSFEKKGWVTLSHNIQLEQCTRNR